MSEKLRVGREHHVLEIGTGSGYQAAVLAHLAKDVISLERFPRLARVAQQRLARLGIANVEIRVADGLEAADELGQFDRIMVTAAMPELPPKLKERLTPGGILIAPVGPRDGVQMLIRLRATPSGFEQDDLLEVRFVPALPGVARTT
jgi:protein-L-isoaspartate(D-aspartate) O-methyltransferase